MSGKYRFICKCPRSDADLDKELTAADLWTCVLEYDECNRC